MMVPQNWCRLKRKRVSHVESGADEKPPESVDISIIRNTIDKHIQGAAEPDMFNDLDWLISKISVFRMLQNLPVTGAAPIPIVTRTYEESFMRECKTDKEKPCIFQTQCECMKIDPQNQFVGVQFPLPNVEKSNGMCLLCMRKTTHILFYNILRDGNRVNCTIQKYGNICNVAGEYHSSAMLICPPGGPVHAMPLPIVAHQRNRYSVVEHFGIRYMKQSGVYMEDFPGTLSSRADVTGDNFKLHPQQCDRDLKAKIKALTDSINLGETDQAVLDKYVFAYFASCTGHAMLRLCDWRQLVVRDEDLFYTRSCRDIGYCIRNIILNNTDEDMLSRVVYNSLPYMKHNRLNFPTFDKCTYTAMHDIVRMVLGCCLGTFNGQKRPPWHMRVNLVVFAHELLSRGNKRDLYLFCTSHTSLVRISAIDYFIHFLDEYMPIEKHTIAKMMTKRESVDMLQLHELKNAMNNFRITCYENSELNFTEINAKAVVTLERCNRLCGQKIKNRQSDTPRPAKIDLSLFQYAMSHNLSLDLVAHVLHPQLTSEQLLKFSYIQNIIAVNPLVEQFRDKQLASIREKAASNTTKVAHSLNCFVCMACVETFTELDKKMRLGEDNALFCMNCKTTEYIVKINCFGIVLAINGKRYFWCPHCCLVHAWTSSGFELDTCALQQDAKAAAASVCFFCRKSVNLEELTILDSRVGIRHKIRACYKHRPWQHQMKYIHDAASYTRAMEYKNSSKIIY